MRRRGLPGPLARLARNRLAASGLAAVSAMAILAAGLSDSLASQLTAQIDANWRGSYDILVRPQATHLGLESTNGLVEPNFLGFSGEGGISLAQLGAIRDLSDVELGAPVSFVGYLRYSAAIPQIVISNLPGRPTLYRVVLTVTTNDGLGDRVLKRQTGEILWGPGSGTGKAHWATNLGDLSPGSPGAHLRSALQLPPIAVPVMAVDPVAEQALLGTSGAFLDPLASITDRANLRADTLSPVAIPPDFQLARDLLFSVNDPSWPNKTDKQKPLVPLVVSTSLYAGLSVQLDIAQLGTPLSAYPSGTTPGQRLAAAEQLAGAGSTALPPTLVDIGAALKPFEVAQLIIPWPGSSPTDTPFSVAWFGSLVTRLAGRPSYVAAAALTGDSAISFTINPVGVVGPDDDPTVPRGGGVSPAVGIQYGVLPAYRTLKDFPLAVQPTIGTPLTNTDADAPFYYAPLGTFDLASLDLPTNPLSYVPMGAYHPPDTQLIAGPDGKPVTPQPVSPTISQAGLVAPPPLALTDMAAAVLLRGDRPIDAIRVKVAGLANFGPDAQAKVERVAAEIASMGLDVDIVAGSSRQPVNLYVPAYLTDANPPTDLGWVRQEWTTLGAATRVDRTFGQANLALGSLAVLATIAFAFGLQFIELGRRRSEIAILRVIGWSSSRIVRWIVAEALLGGFAIAALAAAGWIIGGGAIPALAIGLLLAAIWVLAAVLGSLWAVRSSSTSRVQAREVGLVLKPQAIMASSRLRFALRSLTAFPVRSGVEIAGFAVAAAAVGLSSAELLAVGAAAGPTLLASAVARLLGPLQGALLAACTAAAVVFTITTVVSRHNAERQERNVLRSVGWSDRTIQRTVLLRLYLIALPSAVIASVLVASLSRALSLNVGITFAFTLLLCGAAPLVAAVPQRDRGAHR